MTTDYFSRTHYEDTRILRRELVKAQIDHHEHLKEEGFTFSIMHFNVLADGLTGVHSGMNSDDKFFNVDDEILHWAKRGPKILEEIRRNLPDVICLSELDQPDFMRAHLESLGYLGIFKEREWSEIMRKQYYALYSHARDMSGYSEEDNDFWRNVQPDGCAVYWKQHMFEVDPDCIVKFVQQKDKQILREVLTRAATSPSTKKTPKRRGSLPRSQSDNVDLFSEGSRKEGIWRALRKISNILVTGRSSHHIELRDVTSNDLIQPHATDNVFVDLLYLQGLISDEFHRLHVINQIKNAFGLGAHESRVSADKFVSYLCEKQTPNGLGIILQPKRIAESIQDFNVRILILTAQISERYSEIAYKKRNIFMDSRWENMSETSSRRYEYDYIRREEMESVLTHPLISSQSNVPGTTTFISSTIYPPMIKRVKGEPKATSMAYKYVMGQLNSDPGRKFSSTYQDGLGHGLHEPPFTSWCLRGIMNDDGATELVPLTNLQQRGVSADEGRDLFDSVASDDDIFPITRERSLSPSPFGRSGDRLRDELMDEKCACDFVFYEPDYWNIEKILTIPSQSRLFQSRKRRVDRSPLPTRDYPSSHFAVMASYRLDLKELHISALRMKLQSAVVSSAEMKKSEEYAAEIEECHRKMGVLKAKCEECEERIESLSSDKLRLIEQTAREMQRLRDTLRAKEASIERYEIALGGKNRRRQDNTSVSSSGHARHPNSLSRRTRSTKANSSFLSRWLSMGFEDDESDDDLQVGRLPSHPEENQFGQKSHAYIEDFLDELRPEDQRPGQVEQNRESGGGWGLSRLVSNPFGH